MYSMFWVPEQLNIIIVILLLLVHELWYVILLWVYA